MRALAYEGRRLLGLRSSWLILATALAAGGALVAVLARHQPSGPLAAPAAAHLVTATVPLLALPPAALAAGLLGALAAAHEVRCPGLPAAQVRYTARLRLLLAKLAVTGTVAALLGVAALLVNVLTVRLALPVPDVRRLTALTAVPSRAPFTVQALSTDHHAALLLAGFVALTVATGWTGVLTVTLTRSALVGLLLLGALPTLVARLALPTALDLLHHQGADWAPTHLARALAVVLLPVAVLLGGCLLAQTRRRSF
ncbi:hypothetical protein [Kitasatospora sp. LaBMicrA B282]|uniref:hypothetical protein n=1 Tax=Kitasatospora sp. LaBMicrA B282 TaxID=3420949 RepID=UPI003D0E3C0C